MSKSTQHVTPLFQLVTFFGATLLLIPIFYRSLVVFNAREILPKLTPYTNTTTPIYTGLTIHHFMDSDTIKNIVGIDATLWFAYDPTLITHEQIEQFSFDNATVEKSQISYQRQGSLEIATFDIQVHAKMDFNFKEYPLDDHRIWFSLKNSALPAQKYSFVVNQNSLSLDSTAQISNCVSENIKAQSGFITQEYTLPDGKHEINSSRVLFSFDCNPIDMRHFLNIFLPLYLIFFLTLFSFSFVYAEHTTDVPSIAAASVPALFAYRFVIESISPNVSYFMVSDYLFFLYLVLSLLTFLSISWALNHSVQIKKLIIISLYLLMILGCAGITLAL